MLSLVSVCSHRDFFLSYDELHMLHFALMLCACRNNINASRVDACVSENISELGYILFNAVKGTGEEMAQVVRKDLAR